MFNSFSRVTAWTLLGVYLLHPMLSVNAAPPLAPGCESLGLAKGDFSWRRTNSDGYYEYGKPVPGYCPLNEIWTGDAGAIGCAHEWLSSFIPATTGDILCAHESRLKSIETTLGSFEKRIGELETSVIILKGNVRDLANTQDGLSTRLEGLCKQAGAPCP